MPLYSNFGAQSACGCQPHGSIVVVILASRSRKSESLVAISVFVSLSKARTFAPASSSVLLRSFSELSTRSSSISGFLPSSMSRHSRVSIPMWDCNFFSALLMAVRTVWTCRTFRDLTFNSFDSLIVSFSRVPTRDWYPSSTSCSRADDDDNSSYSPMSRASALYAFT